MYGSHFIIYQSHPNACKRPLIIFDFTTESDLSDWRIMDDVVMGGRSDSNLKINEAGHGCFHGYVSLENYGGFASTRYNLDETLKVIG